MCAVTGTFNFVRDVEDKIIRISPLPRAPVFAGVFRRVKNNMIR